MCNRVTLAAITVPQSQWPCSCLSPRQPAAVFHQVMQGPRQLPLSWSSSRSLAPQISSIETVEGKRREGHIWKGMFLAHAWKRHPLLLLPSSQWPELGPGRTWAAGRFGNVAEPCAYTHTRTRAASEEQSQALDPIPWAPERLLLPTVPFIRPPASRFSPHSAHCP